MNKKFWIVAILYLTLSLTAVWGLTIIFPKEVTQVETVEPSYNTGTPTYDLMTITNSKTIILGNKQRAVLVGVDVINLWLENAKNKEIVSITAFNRGLQGSTSSFLIVYLEK